MHKLVTIATGFGVAVMGLNYITAAQAQDLDRNEGVRDRAREEFDAKGLLSTPLMFFPTFSIGGEYTDNFLAEESNTEDDFIVKSKAGLVVETTWGRHSLFSSIEAAYDQYIDNENESGFDIKARLGGRLDISRQTSFTSEVKFTSARESRSSVDVQGAITEKPIDYRIFETKSRLVVLPLPVGLSTGLDVTYYDYDDGRQIGGGVIDQDNRDKTIYETFLRGSVEVSPDMQLFLEGRYNFREFDLGPSDVAIDRDSDGYELQTGIVFKIGRMAQGTVGLGYFEQNFNDDTSLSDVDGFDFDVGIKFTPTEIFTINLNAGQEVKDASTAGVGGYVSTSVGATADIEIARNIIWSSSVRYSEDDYEGVQRSESRFAAGTLVDLLINRNMGLSFHYNYLGQDSNIAGREFDKNTVGLTLKLQI